MFRKNKHWTVYVAGTIAAMPPAYLAMWLFFKILDWFSTHHVVFFVLMGIAWVIACIWWFLGSVIIMGSVDQ